ncbi:putative lipase transmembrane protein [Reinekea sp. MED297]|uniref:Putative lipase transmembrane protein n=1 Tax=Reinekea blandensis MED297 TaxID=314283 RepID=A4BH64_9GAMM|nr:putative lipase transmembrane protein [Reinekea sp. MED297] [Reinekea blandensis MED297]
MTMLALRALLIGVICIVVTVQFSHQSLSPWRWVRYWVQEFVAFVSLYSVMQALPRRWVQPNDPVTNHHVILAHGFLCNDGFWWRFVPRLRQAGLSVSSVEMPGAFASIEEFQQRLSAEIERVSSINPDAVITLVGFSMGGLAARCLPRKQQQRCELITLYTPHYGTLMAYVPRWVGATNGRQMCPGNPWLSGLKRHPIAFRRMLGVWTRHDTIVIPPIRSRAPFDNWAQSGQGHLSASLDGSLHQRLLDWITEEHSQPDGHGTVIKVSKSNDSNSALKQSMMS